MSHGDRTPTALLSLFLVLALTAGCLSGASSQLPDRATVEESLRSIDGFEATATMTVETGNETVEVRMDVLQRPDTGETRVTMRRSSTDARIVMVSNGTTTWVYNASSRTVTRMDLGGLGVGWNRSADSIGDMFASLANASNGNDVSISPLPVVPAGNTPVGSVGVASMPALGNVSLTYEGTDEVVGREAHVVDLVPATNESLLQNGTLWFDADRYYPLKAEYTMTFAGETTSASMAYRNLTYDPSIPAGTFTFEPPENATVRNASQSIATYDSRAELERAANTSVPEPALPDGFAFEQGSTTDVNGNESLSLEYGNGSETVTVSKRPVTANTGASQGEPIDVGGQEGRIVTFGETTVLTWQCEGSAYTVTGSLSEERLRAIGGSVGCE